LYRKYENYPVPVISWCEEVDANAFRQAENLARHPRIFHHIALMPDCHVGYGMPIGGVIACRGAMIPNAVGVDIGCGMAALETGVDIAESTPEKIESLIKGIKKRVPLGEGRARTSPVRWAGFDRYFDGVKNVPLWAGKQGLELDRKNLGTLGGGNHFIEIQKSSKGKIWLMLHSGSRNLGYRVAKHYHAVALDYVKKKGIVIPDDDLAFIERDEHVGDYERDMNFALSYAAENRRIMIDIVMEEFAEVFKTVRFGDIINIHHNYAAREKHFGEAVWIHRKGATSAFSGQKGIIPGSMGTASYIVSGLGNEEAFCSCSHGAGRVMGRMEASRVLSVGECDRAMGDVIHDPWKKSRKRKGKALFDLGESPLAYKNIDRVIQQQRDLVDVVEKLYPMGVIKG